MDRTKVIEALEKIFRQVTPETDFSSLNFGEPLRDQVEIDSLDYYNILVRVHKNLGVSIPEHEVMNMENLNALITYIQDHA